MYNISKLIKAFWWLFYLFILCSTLKLEFYHIVEPGLKNIRLEYNSIL